jgi:hypothetical protein
MEAPWAAARPGHRTPPEALSRRGSRGRGAGRSDRARFDSRNDRAPWLGRCRGLVALQAAPPAKYVPACVSVVGGGRDSSLLSCVFLGRKAAHGDDAEAEVAHLVEDAMQGRLVGQRAREDGLAALVVDSHHPGSRARAPTARGAHRGRDGGRCSGGDRATARPDRGSPGRWRAGDPVRTNSLGAPGRAGARPTHLGPLAAGGRRLAPWSHAAGRIRLRRDAGRGPGGTQSPAADDHVLPPGRGAAAPGRAGRGPAHLPGRATPRHRGRPLVPGPRV